MIDDVPASCGGWTRSLASELGSALRAPLPPGLVLLGACLSARSLYVMICRFDPSFTDVPGALGRMDQARLELDEMTSWNDGDAGDDSGCILTALAEISMMGVCLRGILAGAPVVVLFLLPWVGLDPVLCLLAGLAVFPLWCLFQIFWWRRGVDAAVLELRMAFREFSRGVGLMPEPGGVVMQRADALPVAVGVMLISGPGGLGGSAPDGSPAI